LGNAGEQRQARGGCIADLVLAGQAPGDAPNTYLYTFATGASLRAAAAASATPAPTPMQQASLLVLLPNNQALCCLIHMVCEEQHKSHCCSHPRVAVLVLLIHCLQQKIFSEFSTPPFSSLPHLAVAQAVFNEGELVVLCLEAKFSRFFCCLAFLCSVSAAIP